MHEMTAHSMQTRTGFTTAAGALFASSPAERERCRQGLMKLSSFLPESIAYRPLAMPIVPFGVRALLLVRTLIID